MKFTHAPQRALGSLCILGCFLAIALFVSPDASASSCFAPPSGLIGWWPAEGDATDITGTNNGSLLGGATASALGMVGSAFSFDGTNGFVQVPNAPELNPTNLTIECWVLFKSLDSGGISAPAGRQYIAFKQNTANNNFEGFDLSKNRGAGGDYFLFNITDPGTGNSPEVDSVTHVAINTWYHLAGVRGSNYMQLYVNGKLEAQTNITFPQNFGSLPLFFGSSGASFWDRKLNGLLDEVSYYNRALSSNEIAAIYAAGAAGKCHPPHITVEPQSLARPINANVTLSVTATGDATLFYQWQRNGANLSDGGRISGSTNATLSLATVQTNDSANYQVIITNTVGAVTSAVAVLTVDGSLVPPQITVQPASQSVLIGAPVNFAVTAIGPGPLSYQWFFNGANLPNAAQYSGTNSQTLSLSDALPANAGGYSVLVSNPYGASTSRVANLTVDSSSGFMPPFPGLVGWWPGEGTANDIIGTNSGSLQGGITATNPGVVGKAFTMDGTSGFVQIPNAPELNPTNLTVECWVRFDTLDTPGTSTLGAQYIVFKQNTRDSAFEGYNLSKHRYAYDIFVWEASSATGQAIQINGSTSIQTNVWYYVAGVRGPDYLELYINGQLEVRTNLYFPQDYGNHPLYFGTSNESYWDHKLGGALDEVCLYNRALSAAEIMAIYQTGPAGKRKAPSVLIPPKSQTAYWHGSATLGSSITGPGPLHYQWLMNGSPIAGATTSSLVLTNLQWTNAALYSLVITNSFGSITSAPAMLNLKLADFTLAPRGTYAPGTAAFNIAGVPAQTYGIQWSDNLLLASHWQGLTNLVLTNTSQLWRDPQPASLPARFYRVVPGPISIP